MDQGVTDVAESLLEGLQEQLVFARKVFVKASMCQAGVAHHRCNCCAVKTFGAYAPRGVFHNLLMDFRFVFGPVTHRSRAPRWNRPASGRSCGSMKPTPYSTGSKRSWPV